MVSSAISTKSRSRMRFTTFVGSVAAGLKGPLLLKVGDGPRDAPVAGATAVPDVEAAAARKSRPKGPGWLGENTGSVASVDGVEPVEKGMVSGELPCSTLPRYVSHASVYVVGRRWGVYRPVSAG